MSMWIYTRARPLSQCSIVCVGGRILSRRNVEKDLSVVATLTNNVTGICVPDN